MFEPTELMTDLASTLMEELDLTDKDSDIIESEYEKYMDLDSYQKIEFTYYGTPKAQARARITSNFTHFFDPDKSFKQFVNEQVRFAIGNDFKPISKEIYFTARFYRPTPKKLRKKDIVLAELGIIRPTTKPDLDNYEKLFYDALNGFLYTDDGVIIHGNHSKFFSCKPRVEVTILYRK